MPSPFCIHSPLLNPVSPDKAQWFPEGVVAVGEDGRILFSGASKDLPASLEVLPSKTSRNLLLPGMIDTHVHLPQHDCRGKFGTSLLEWLDRFIFPEEQRFADAVVARDISQRFFHGLARAGTTTAMVYSSVHTESTNIAFEEAEQSGLRIVMGKLMMNREAPRALLEDDDEALSSTEELIQSWHRKNDRLYYAVTPRFAPTSTMELMKRASILARRYDTYVQTHLNESAGELERVRELFPDAPSYTHIYREAGLLTEKTVLGHNIRTDAVQLNMLAETGSAVSHCPDSNLFLGSGRFPLDDHIRAGVRFGLGSDVGAGTTLDMFHPMRAMSYVQDHSLHPFLPLYHATQGGADSLSLGDTIGSLSPGKQADMIELRIDNRFCLGKSLEQLSAVEIASVVVYRQDSDKVQRTWVGGETVYSRDK